MNERMLELYKQAQVVDTAIDPSNNMPYETTTFSAEKFAELIVRECITLGTNFTNRNYSDDAGERIAKHFGVEE
jgi:hypothetical protein